MATKCFSLPFPSSVSSSPSFQQTPGLPVIKHLKCIMFTTRFDSLPTPMACSPVCPSVNDYLFQDISRIGVWLRLTKYCSYFRRLLIDLAILLDSLASTCCLIPEYNFYFLLLMELSLVSSHNYIIFAFSLLLSLSKCSPLYSHLTVMGFHICGYHLDILH